MTEIEKMQKTKEIMKQAADELSEKFKGLGFVLIVFEFYKPGISNYISNAKREDMIKALRESANMLERKQDFPSRFDIKPTIQ